MTFTSRLAESRSGARPALFPYMMCGLLPAKDTMSLFSAMAEAGADGFEVGIPYADPLMDGPVIQEAGTRALDNGMTLAAGIDRAGLVATETGLPVAVMTYVNPVMRLGPDAFAERLAEQGIEAAILADLPVDESDGIADAFGSFGVGLVQFAAPTTTDARLDRVAAKADPFVYAVAEMGVTGERTSASGRVRELASRIRERSDVAVVTGVGIATAEQAAAAGEHCEGVIVGSALVRRVLESGSATEAAESVASLVGEMAASLSA